MVKSPSQKHVGKSIHFSIHKFIDYAIIIPSISPALVVLKLNWIPMIIAFCTVNNHIYIFIESYKVLYIHDIPILHGKQTALRRWLPCYRPARSSAATCESNWGRPTRSAPGTVLCDMGIGRPGHGEWYFVTGFVKNNVKNEHGNRM